MMRTRYGTRPFILAALVLIGVFFLLPLLWLVSTPFSAEPTLAVKFSQPSLGNFLKIAANRTALIAFKNSLILSGGAMILVVVLGSLAAYSLSRANFSGKQAILSVLLLFSSVVTGVAAMVPIYTLNSRLHLIDTHIGVILIFAAGFLPTAIFILKDFMDRIPRAYEEAALVDGSSPVQLFRYVAFPLARQGLAVIAVLTFVNTWSNFLVPFVLIRSNEKIPIAVAIYQFFSEVGIPRIGVISAYSLLYTLPVLVIYFWISRRYGFGFFGGIKG
ncbi:MAG: carbohydrate ABC transporter permease [Elusimicrobia bacterium]|nr:carbohydrate ABC transporter permease [Elusimicrobiota bacterium]